MILVALIALFAALVLDWNTVGRPTRDSQELQSGMNDTTAAILDHVRSLGYIVKEFRVNGTVEFHAVPYNGGASQVARCNDGVDDESAYQAARMLAAAVGIGNRT